MANAFRSSFVPSIPTVTAGILTITCAPEFAGTIIYCTDGQSTLLETCPSIDPYTVSFNIPRSGIWNISSTVNEKTYTTSIEVDLEPEGDLEYSFVWQKWVLAGGLDPSDYANLEEVLEDETAIRRLMTIHASADYLIEKVNFELDTIDIFCTNKNAMKWIGLRDYICDKLMEIDGVTTKFLNSEYWDFILKDHIPVLTANATPFGTAAATTGTAWYAFNNNDTNQAANANSTVAWGVQYKFTTPICIKKIELKTGTGYLAANINYVEASLDGTTWVRFDTDLSSITESEKNYSFNINNNNYYFYYRIFKPANSTKGGDTFKKVQFYGRSLNKAIPLMTSSNVPFGESSAPFSLNTNMVDWRVFDNESKTYGWYSGNDHLAEECYVQYKFPTKIRCKVIEYLTQRTGDTTAGWSYFSYFKGSNDGENFKTIAEDFNTAAERNVFKYAFVTDPDEYQYFRWTISNHNINGGLTSTLGQMNFYGVDYSEREFASDNTRMWIYDHGYELVPILEKFTGTGSTVEKQENQIYLNGGSGTSKSTGAIIYTAPIDLTNYKTMRASLGDIASATPITTMCASSTEEPGYNWTSGYLGYTDFAQSTLNLPHNLYLNLNTYEQEGTPAIAQFANKRISTITEWWLE